LTGTSGDLGELDPRPAPLPPNMTVFITGPGHPCRTVPTIFTIYGFAKASS
jgi:hypothetical protein